MGFRGLEVGPDTPTYYLIYQSIEQGGANYIEPLWRILNLIVINCFDDFHFLLLCVSVLILLLVYLSSKRTHTNIFLALFIFYSLYFVFYSMNIMRQMISVVIILYGYTFLKENKIKYFIFSVFFALLFHYTTIIVAVLFLFRKFALTPQKVVLYIFASIIIGIFFNLGTISFLFGSYQSYLLRDQFYRESVFIPFLLSLILSIFFICLYLTSNTSLKKDLFMKIFFFGILLNNLMVKFELGTRMMMFFSIIQILLLPMYLNNNRIQQKEFVRIGIIVYLGVIFFTLLSIGSVGIYPYSNILFP